MEGGSAPGCGTPFHLLVFVEVRTCEARLHVTGQQLLLVSGQCATPPLMDAGDYQNSNGLVWVNPVR